MTKLQPQSLIKGALMAAASKGTARLLRFLLLTVIAYKFGRNFETDAYLIVQSLTVLFLTVNDTIFNFSLIPILVDERVKKGEEEARELGGSAFAYFNLFFFLVSLAIFIFAAPLARLMGPGLSPESQELAAVIIRIISPIPFLAGLGGVPASIFYSHRNFMLPNITFTFYGMSSLIAAVLFAEIIGIRSIPYGAAFGVFLQAVVLIIALRKAGGLKFTFRRHRRFGEVMKLTGPRVVGRILADLNLIIDKAFASGFGQGAITGLTMAFRLNQFTFGLLISPLGVSMPAISEKVTRGEFKELRDLAVRIMGLITFMVLPVMAGFYVMRVEVVAMLFERGEFTRVDTLATASAFLYFNIGALFVAMDILLLGAFYALREPRIPLFINILTFVLNIILDLLFIELMGLNGIALAKSVIATINIVLLFWMLQKRIGALDWKKYLAGSFARIAPAAVSAGATAHLAMTLLTQYVSDNVFLLVAAGAMAGGCVYIGLCAIFGTREVKEIYALITKKLKGRKNRNG